ncbi:FxsA family protein [Azospirillum ramasamyi]|uniref:FxsA family protein n=1 Tax=Azospirillum ramasamyi TaxID=682998 RepID=A0A2U9S8G8_9PROT|nr:FxsA family protein [Azospirillum ramasamyi]AWU94876.1 FxsA family protein [Azospirillum ramasamyi]
MNPLLLILILPILEIVGFIQVGDWIGAGPTIGLLILSAVVGVILVRHRGLAALTRAQAAAARGETPIGTVLDGFCEVLAGILLIIPGFLTDILGLLLLIRPLRRGMGRWFLRRAGAGMSVFTMGGTTADGRHGFGHGGFGQPGFGSGDARRADDPFRPAPGVIDVDYRDVTPGEDGTGDGKDDGKDAGKDHGKDDADAPRLTDSQWGKNRPDERR